MGQNALKFDIDATLLPGKCGARVVAIGRDILSLLFPDWVYIEPPKPEIDVAP